MKNKTRVVKIEEETHKKMKDLQNILFQHNIKLTFDKLINEMLDKELEACKKYNKK